MGERSVGRQSNATRGRHPGDGRLGWIAQGLAAVAVVAVVAAPGFGQARVDWNYELAGLADPFLGRPAPGWTLLWVGAAIVLYMIGVGVALWLMERPSQGRALVARWWWLVPAAALGGYFLGALVTVAAGGPVDHPGTMRLQLGPPFNTSVEVPATCTTAPGRPDALVLVRGEGDGLPAIRVANEATGVPLDLPGRVSTETARPASGPAPEVVIPGMPERPPMYEVAQGVDGLESRAPITFLHAYGYYPVNATVDAWTGSARLDARRNYAPAFIVDQLVPDDPWPASYALTVSWACDPAIVKAAPVPTPWPTGDRWVPTTPPTAPPSPPAVVPVQLELVTSSEWATVRLGGATIASVSDPRIEAGADATYEDGLFRVEPHPPADRAAGATFQLGLTGLAPDSVLTLEIDHGPTGTASVTLSNDLGEAPVPVGGYLGTSRDRPGWPVELPARWFLQPVTLQP